MKIAHSFCLLTLDIDSTVVILLLERLTTNSCQLFKLQIHVHHVESISTDSTADMNVMPARQYDRKRKKKR